MPYIIDGHNLIAAMPGIELHDPDDERALLELLQPLAALETRQIFVYFDQGRTGGRNEFKFGRVRVRFAVPPRTADDAIRAHLQKISAEAPNWVIVSSDREVQQEAARVGARTLSSPAFIEEKLKQSGARPEDEKPRAPLSPHEIERWEALFRDGEEEV
ncbi:MAG: NYN domain-containing protein [Anaerolineales bacterium]|nr:NYN domain-containing protein [Anaerolineales bacterium]